MTTATKQSMRDAIREHFAMPDRIQDLASMSHADLWYGPYTAADYAEECPERETQWPGFSMAVDELEQWAAAVVCEVWFDADSDCIMESEPECGYEDEETGEWQEYCMEETFYVSRMEVLSILFGKELAKYI